MFTMFTSSPDGQAAPIGAPSRPIFVDELESMGCQRFEQLREQCPFREAKAEAYFSPGKRARSQLSDSSSDS